MRKEGLAALVAILVVASLGTGYFIATAGQHTITSTQTETAISGTNSATATIVTTCEAPPPPVQGDVGSFEPNPLSVAGATSACAVALSASPGSVPLANFMVTLNATKPLNLTMGFIYNGDTAVPPPTLAGINLTVSDGIPDTAAAEPVAIQINLANATLIAIPSGETAFYLQAQVPKLVSAGTYSFDLMILVSPGDTGGLEGGGVDFPVNLDVQ